MKKKTGKTNSGGIPPKEELFDQLLEKSPIYIFFKDTEIRPIHLSRNYENMLGRPLAEILGKKMDELFPADLAGSMISDDKQVLNEGIPVFREEHLNGRYYQTTKFPIIKKKNSSYLAGFTVDVTERRIAEEALKESEARYKVYSGLTTDYFCRLGVAPDGRLSLEYVSENFFKITGRRIEEAIDLESWKKIFHPDDFDKVQIFLSSLLQKPLKAEMHCRSYLHDGSLRWISITAQSESDSRTGRICSILAAVKDITEKRKMEEEFLKVQKLESLGFLAGGIAHDFNNLLGGIYGHINLALLNLEDNYTRSHLEASLKTMDRARNLTRQLLTFAKGGAPVVEKQNLLPFLQESIEFALSGSAVICRFDFKEPLPACAFDRNQISQVIENLVINAQQAMPSGGNIEVTADSIQLKQGEHPILAAGYYVMISIRDYGTGIDPDVLPHIFDPFFSTKAMGYGLGLATSHSIVSRHGGCIEVDSVPGQGSVFSFYLPAEREPVNSREEKKRTSTGGQGTILIVDDEKAILDTMGGLLIHLGFDVLPFLNTIQALAYLQEAFSSGRTLSACFFDLTIPGDPGGLGIIEEVRRLFPQLRVFVMSGYADDQVMADPRKFKFTGSLRKPFNLHEITALLEKYSEHESVS